MKQWCTWERNKVDDKNYHDPNTFLLCELITFHETQYNDGDSFIGYIEGDELDINNYCIGFEQFNITKISELEANTFLTTWYNNIEIHDGIIIDDRDEVGL